MSTVCTSSESSGKTVHMCQLGGAFAAHICDEKFHGLAHMLIMLVLFASTYFFLICSNTIRVSTKLSALVAC